MNLTVVLVSPRNPLNIGAVARAMSNFGCHDLRLVCAYREAEEEAKSATHAGSVLAQSRDFDTLAAAVSDCTLVVGTASLRAREVRHEIHRLESAAEVILSSAGKTALVFGSEKSGLSNDDLAHCHWLLTIPVDAEHGSMNLGQAVAVCLYELARGREIRGIDNRRRSASAGPADGETEQRIAALLFEALERSGYGTERTGTSMRLKVQRLVKRMGLNRKDAQMWQGMLRQILWKLVSSDSDKQE